MQESASFWTDIKALEEQLDKFPDSYCFARLSDVYLRLGLVEDALHVARQGVIKHPGYLSGQRALSLACHAKGLTDEALTALKLVTEAFPEDVPSQKLLGRIYTELSDPIAAGKAFRTALEFAPDDVECQIELESIERSAGGASSFVDSDDEDNIIEDLEMLEEIDILEEESYEVESRDYEASQEPYVSEIPQYDPLSTVTLAELYVKQGFIDKACDIYRTILAGNSTNIEIATRLAELEVLEISPAPLDAEFEYSEDTETAADPVVTAASEELFRNAEPETLPETGFASDLQSQPLFQDESGSVVEASLLPVQGTADNVLATFDGWLENIRRIKSCR